MNPLIINFWKLHDHPKASLEVIRLPSWPKIVKFSVKMRFFMFLTPEKPVFELMTNLEFSFLKVKLEVFTFSQTNIFIQVFKLLTLWIPCCFGINNQGHIYMSWCNIYSDQVFIIQTTNGRIYMPMVVREKYLWPQRWPLKDIYICPWHWKCLRVPRKCSKSHFVLKFSRRNP